MDPKTGFDAAIQRPEHLLRLYELLHDTRRRSVRSDWATSFRRLMHWPAGERFVRVDGRKGQSMLLMRESIAVSRQHFTHEYLSELLRSALVATVSAMDRFCHDSVVQHAWKLLSRKDVDIPVGMCRFQLPVLETKKALEKLRRDPKSRPGSIVKKAIQDQLHKRTFQTPGDVEALAQLLGITNVWAALASKMSGGTAADIKDTLSEIARRRNQIAHEADLVLRTRSSKISLRDIDYKQCYEWVQFIKSFVAALDAVVAATV